MKFTKAAVSGALALAVAIFAGQGACRKKTFDYDARSTIVLGQYASLTGGTADFGKSSNDGLQLALEQINASGGLLGKQVSVTTEDDQSNSDNAVAAVSKLINRDKVSAVIGEVASTRSLSGGGICQSSRIPMLSPASTNPQVTKTGDYIFRICFTDDFQGKICARFAKDQGWKRVAMLTDTANAYSKGLATAFKENFPVDMIVADENFKAEDKNFEAQLNKIKATNPDAIYLPAYYTEVGLIVTQARRAGMTMPFFGGDGWDSPQTQSNPDTVGCFYSDHYSANDPSEATQKFVKAFAKKYGHQPDAMAVLGYDAMGVMAQAIKDAGSADPKAIRDALAKIKNYDGASGQITIDENRNATKSIVILNVTGKPVPDLAKRYDPGE